ncbi:hypothetical protein BZA77DRAFT_289571 [Pyronema omphalodes]|nr:hypothetical protein BZA77DRAFT_289571 [Pyronema omphalodes]
MVSEMLNAEAVSHNCTTDNSAEEQACDSRATNNNNDTGLHDSRLQTAEPVSQNLQPGPDQCSTASPSIPADTSSPTTALDQEQANNARRLGNAKYKSLLSDFSNGNEDPDNIEPPGPLDREYDRRQDPEVYSNTYANMRIPVSSDDPIGNPNPRNGGRRVTLNPSVQVMNCGTGTLSKAPLMVYRGEKSSQFRNFMWICRRRMGLLGKGASGNGA